MLYFFYGRKNIKNLQVEIKKSVRNFHIKEIIGVFLLMSLLSYFITKKDFFGDNIFFTLLWFFIYNVLISFILNWELAESIKEMSFSKTFKILILFLINIFIFFVYGFTAGIQNGGDIGVAIQSLIYFIIVITAFIVVGVVKLFVNTNKTNES